MKSTGGLHLFLDTLSVKVSKQCWVCVEDKFSSHSSTFTSPHRYFVLRFCGRNFLKANTFYLFSVLTLDFFMLIQNLAMIIDITVFAIVYCYKKKSLPGWKGQLFLPSHSEWIENRKYFEIQSFEQSSLWYQISAESIAKYLSKY